MQFGVGAIGRLYAPGNLSLGAPLLSYDFASSVPSPFAFTRASGATDSTWMDAVVQQTYTTLANDVPIINQWGLKIEPAASNLFLNSNAPVTQDIALTTGNYILWTVGASAAATITATATAGTIAFTPASGVASTGAPVAISVTSGTATLHLVPAGSPYRVQVEAGNSPTSYIVSAASAGTRAESRLQASVGQLNRLNGTYWVEFMTYAVLNGARVLTAGSNSYTQDNETDQLVTLAGVGSGSFRVFTPAATLAVQADSDGTPQQMRITRIAAAYSPQRITCCANAGVVGSASGARPAALTGVTLGGGGNSDALNGFIRGFRYWNAMMSDQELRSCTGIGYFPDKPVFDLDGTVMNQWRMWSVQRTAPTGTITDATADQPAGTPFNTYTQFQIRATSRGLMTDPNRTNSFPNSATLAASGTISGLLLNQGYFVWMRGSGSITMSAGTATIQQSLPAVVTQGNPFWMLCTAAGTINWTATGTVEMAMFENTSAQPQYPGLTNGPSAYIRTTGGAQSRPGELVTLPIGLWYNLNELTWYAEFMQFAGVNGAAIFSTDDLTSGAALGTNRDTVSMTVIGGTTGVLAGNTIVGNLGQGATTYPTLAMGGYFTPMVWHKVAFTLSVSRGQRWLTVDGNISPPSTLTARFASQARMTIGGNSLLFRRVRYYDYAIVGDALRILTT